VGLRTRERVGANGGARGHAEATRAAPGVGTPRAGAEGHTQGAEAARRGARSRGEPPLRGGAGAGSRRGQGRARRGEGEGARREEKGKEREKERGEGRGGELTSGSNSGDHRLQNLGHHGRERERDGREREVAAREKSNEANGSGGGGRVGRAGPGHIVDRNPRHARPLNGNQSRTEIQNGTRRTRDIRQRNALWHDATPMTLRFCLYMTRTPATILV
jgi:hypothetical protein